MSDSEELPKDPSNPLLVQIATQSVLLGIPYIGASLERAIFGASTERRQRRFEQTLFEVGQRLADLEATARVESDQFVRLLESVSEPIASAVTSERRARFRDLLVNAAREEHSDAEWEEAVLAADLLERIADPGLEIVATIWRYSTAEEEAVIVFDAPARFHSARRDAYHPERGVIFSHSGALIEEWLRRLGQLHITSGDQPLHMREPDRPRVMFRGQGHLKLTGLGDLLVRWVVDSDRLNASPAPES